VEPSTIPFATSRSAPGLRLQARTCAPLPSRLRSSARSGSANRASAARMARTVRAATKRGRFRASTRSRPPRATSSAAGRRRKFAVPVGICWALDRSAESATQVGDKDHLLFTRTCSGMQLVPICPHTTERCWFARVLAHECMPVTNVRGATEHEAEIVLGSSAFARRSYRSHLDAAACAQDRCARAAHRRTT
jgi:hypothetical protein